MRNTVCFFKMFYYKQDKFTKLSLIGIFFQLIFHFRNSSDRNVKIVKLLQSGKKREKVRWCWVILFLWKFTELAHTHNAKTRSLRIRSESLFVSPIRISVFDSFSSQLDPIWASRRTQSSSIMNPFSSGTRLR